MCVFIPIFRLQRIQLSDTIRCIKSCQPNDVACVLDPTHSLSHTFISLPTFREFLKPEGRYQSVLEPHNICKIHCSWILEVTHTNMIVRLPPTSLFPSLLLFFITLNLLSAYHIHFPAVVIISLTGFDNLPPQPLIISSMMHLVGPHKSCPIGTRAAAIITCRHWLVFNTLVLNIRGS